MPWPVQDYLEFPGQHCTGFLPVQCCFKRIKAILKRIFSCAMMSGASWAILHMTWFLTVQCCPRESRQHYWKGFFSCAILFGVSRTKLHRVFPMHCCPRGINTMLHMIFPMQFAMLSGSSWAKLHAQNFYLCNVVPRGSRQHWTVSLLVHCCLEPQGQHCTKFLPVQCCPTRVLRQHWTGFFSCAVLSSAVGLATLHNGFNCACWSMPSR